MKAVILAAGTGSRLGKYTRDLPKGMLSFGGLTLIQRQVRVLNQAGVRDIVIVTGYRSEAIDYAGVRYHHNHKYESTNMVESLLCARSELDSDVLVAYSDVIYTPKLVRQPSPVAVAVDPEWRSYWMMRYGTTETDLETLTVADGRIVDLGEPVGSSTGVDYRYVGVTKFSEDALDALLSLYDGKKIQHARWRKSGNTFENGYMTDLLSELIDSGVLVTPVMADRQWLEFDTERDYEVSLRHLEGGTLDRVFDMEATVAR